MRNNQPITSVETVLPDGEFIYSRTDLKGTILEANDAFCRISDYTPEQMVGQPHNMVRHPDMPPEAFADMWRDLLAGRPWRGLVKNRRRDGGFYWVVANASPVRENGHVVGYQSVRGKPSREEIAAADSAYRRIRSGDKSIAIEHGRVVQQRPAWLNTVLSLRFQMICSGLLSLLLALLPLFETITGWVLPNSLKWAVGGGGGLFAAYFLFIYIPRVLGDLDSLSEALEGVLTSGNLSKRFDLPRRDVIGVISRRADKIMSALQATLQGLSNSAELVLQSTKEVSNGVTSIHAAASAQNDATSSAAAAIEEIATSTSEVAAHAQRTFAAAESTGAASRSGVTITHHASQTINALSLSVRESAEQVESLGRRSEEIGRIAGVIREITDQTNLLALNAAIEAARAGETGRGFAVVADEVRKLAERTAKATEEISSMIQTIQHETGLAVAGMRAGASQVIESVDLVNQAESALRHIDKEMNETVRMVADISHATGEQQTATTLLAQNVEQVASMTEQNVSVVTQSNVMVNQLETAVERMKKAVRQYGI